ncbi:MAG TPA: hypothetical protein VFA08_07485 [Actinomycetota bacterium]|jgi:hypothetical protein|nr:hypothetical protein [Actinomycetota bacterium]
MHQPDDPYSPAERATRRRVFSSPPTGEPGPEPTAQEGIEHIEQLMESYKAAIQEQLEEGLSGIRHTAGKLMQEVANEDWSTTEGSSSQARSRLVHDRERNQAIRSLIPESRQHGAPLAVKDVAALRAQLADITRQIAGALHELAERDQEVIEAVRSRILEHGQLMTSETTRISRAMETYVQHGVEAMGKLAGSMEAQVHLLTTRGDAIAERVREIVEPQTALLGEQLQLMYDRMAIDTAAISEATSSQTERDEQRGHELAEQVQLVYERMAIDTRSITDAVSELNTAMSRSIMGIARMVRSDAEALRSEIVRTARTDDGQVASILEDRLARVTDEIEAGTTRLVEQLNRGIAEAHAGLTANLTRALEQQTPVSEERIRSIEERLDEAAGELDAKLAGRIEGLGRLVRSDNVTLAEQVSAGQAATKQTLRALKELQANLPGDVIELVEQRLASLAETIERSNETLGKRIDMVADSIGRRQDSEIQVVIDRMGDAMHALAGLGRVEEEERPPERIELE